MKAIIIDDEQHCIDSLLIQVEKHCPEVIIADTCLSGFCGMESIERHRPDLVFLDIAMPKMNGFDMLSRLDEISFEIIFTTAYDNYAIQAFKVSAADYLLKPIDRNKLVQAVQMVADRIRLKNQAYYQQSRTEQLQMLLENLQHNTRDFPKLALPTMQGLEIVAEEDILYLVGDSNYVHVYIRNTKPLMLAKTIKYVEERLHAGHFFRVHHSYLVNIREVKKYIRGDGGIVEMSDGKQLPVAKNRKTTLLSILRA
ncbi:MAG: DNA-binding response regulator [Bacteroidia bacterium]|nr:MAG: DNA-binding response regulator [Bacteroidia bacterium]